MAETERLIQKPMERERTGVDELHRKAPVAIAAEEADAEQDVHNADDKG